MAHDHSQRIHYCNPCGYWHVANGRLQTWQCPKCLTILASYASRAWIIENVDKKFEAIPIDKVWSFNEEGYV